MDKRRSRYPYCIVWTPIPCLTWFLPFIGHMGICNSEGKVFDFAGPYYIGVDDMAFGTPTRYLRLQPRKVTKGTWDRGVAKGCEVYCQRMHNLCCDNCHSHVARCLDTMGYGGFSNWNMIILCFWVFFCAPFVNFSSFLKTFLPFLLLLTIIFAVKYGAHL